MQQALEHDAAWGRLDGSDMLEAERWRRKCMKEQPLSTIMLPLCKLPGVQIRKVWGESERKIFQTDGKTMKW